MQRPTVSTSNLFHVAFENSRPFAQIHFRGFITGEPVCISTTVHQIGQLLYRLAQASKSHLGLGQRTMLLPLQVYQMRDSQPYVKFRKKKEYRYVSTRLRRSKVTEIPSDQVDGVK